MEARAILRTARISPQKARLVADQVRGMPVAKASDLLQFSDKKAAHIIRKVLMSAISNAENNQGADVDELKVATICVDEGPMIKRFMARAKGRGNRILKRTSHITVIVGRMPDEQGDVADLPKSPGVASQGTLPTLRRRPGDPRQDKAGDKQDHEGVDGVPLASAGETQQEAR